MRITHFVKTKREFYFLIVSMVVGVVLGVFLTNALVPNANEWIMLYREESSTLRLIKEGKLDATNLLAKSIRTEGDYLQYVHAHHKEMIDVSRVALSLTLSDKIRSYASTTLLYELGQENEVDDLTK